jgi:hypothetical protein
LRAEPKLNDESHLAFREGLDESGSILYLVSAASRKLERIQVSRDHLQVEDIAPRLRSEIARFGTPAGAWDCPALPSSLPTRRYVWREDDLAWMDSYLLYGERVAATLYVADAQTIKQSLAKARCTPTPIERAARFPAFASDPRALELPRSEP